MQTMQQMRAKHALQQVDHLKKLNGADKFKSRASELPFMIHANGLGQALAFFKSKGDKDGYGELYAIINSWLRTPGRPFAGSADCLVALTQCDQQTYMVAQSEAMQYMDWVKKFAGAYLEEKQ